MFDFKFHLKELLLTIFQNNFITTLLGIFSHEIGNFFFSHWDWGRYSAQKTQSENHCKCFKSVLRTVTKSVLFSNLNNTAPSIGTFAGRGSDQRESNITTGLFGLIILQSKSQKIISFLKLLGKSVHSYKSRSKAIVYDFVE